MVMAGAGGDREGVEDGWRDEVRCDALRCDDMRLGWVKAGKLGPHGTHTQADQEADQEAAHNPHTHKSTPTRRPQADRWSRE